MPQLDKDLGDDFEYCDSSDEDRVKLTECATKRRLMRQERHGSWLRSHEPPSPWHPLRNFTIIVTIISVGAGMGIGYAFSLEWGIASGLIIAGALFIISFILLLIYMASYGNGMTNPPLPQFIIRGGFLLNIRANIVCRAIMMCCNNPCKCNIVGILMSGEAQNTAKQIRKLNGGKGPEPGGVCWLGDSEFTFWHNLREDMKAFHPNNFNAGFGGSRLIDIERHLEKLCLDWNPETVIIHAGGNDFDFAEADISPEEMPERLMALFHVIAAHPSVKRMGYFLSSRRPIYSDDKWEFMVSKHQLTIDAIESSDLHDKIKILDLRDMSHPVEDFLVDRVHLNDEGHAAKAKVLLPLMLEVWPPEKDLGGSNTSSESEPEASVISKLEPFEIERV